MKNQRVIIPAPAGYRVIWVFKHEEELHFRPDILIAYEIIREPDEDGDKRFFGGVIRGVRPIGINGPFPVSGASYLVIDPSGYCIDNKQKEWPDIEKWKRGLNPNFIEYV